MAYDELQISDAFNMPQREFVKAIMSFREDEDLHNGWKDFMRRCEVVEACFKTAAEGLPSVQAFKMVDSCTTVAKQCGRSLLSRWRAKCEEVHRACVELLVEEQAIKRNHRKKQRKRLEKQRKRLKKQITIEDEECIICLDAQRNHAFKPCGHNVSCEECAVALRSRSDRCPWCRGLLL